MKRALFVSNGHGEEAIASRIAAELRTLCPQIGCDHLGLVGEKTALSDLTQVGPRRAMPSGGLIAMGNVRNIWSDLRNGLLGLTVAQWRFLRSQRHIYDVAVGVGDIFAFVMARRAKARATVFVGTAKSVYVAPYGAGEARILRAADAVFVRDEPTAAQLNALGVDAQAPGNTIADLFSDRGAVVPQFPRRLAIFPGSRDSAYGDAVFLCAVVRAAARADVRLGGTLSLAPGLDRNRFAAELARDGWSVESDDDEHVPFVLSDGGRTVITAWTGPPGSMLENALAVLGQAGTANEAAASAGIPVIAFERPGESAHGWYRMRQRGLLGAALRIIAGDVAPAAAELRTLLADEAELHAMGAVGRARMGAPGGSTAIAKVLAELVQC